MLQQLKKLNQLYCKVITGVVNITTIEPYTNIKLSSLSPRLLLNQGAINK